MRIRFYGLGKVEPLNMSLDQSVAGPVEHPVNSGSAG